MTGAAFRSILILPAARRAMDAALASGADALALDLAGADATEAAALVAEARAAGRIVLARIHPLDSGLADAELDAVLPARPWGVLLPDACGGRDAQHLGAKLAVREAENGFEDGVTKILALAADRPAAVFELGSFARAGRRLAGLGRDEGRLAQSLGLEDWDRGERPEPLRVARSLSLFAAAAAGVPAYDAAEAGEGEDFARACALAARDGFAGKFARTPEQARLANAAFSRARKPA